jgi:hypothetical protein
MTVDLDNCVRIRMYRQGLGDCFLLTIPDGKARSHVLIDFGVLTGTRDAEARMRAVAKNIVEVTKNRLNLLVVTHEHWDHVSGFLQAKDVLKDLRIGEIWLAWTEKPGDYLAGELRRHKKQAMKAVTSAARKMRGMTGLAARQRAERLDTLLGFYGDMGIRGGKGARGGKTTSGALQWVKKRKGAKMRYFDPEEQKKPAAVPGVGNVHAFVLGPPRNRADLKKSRPGKTNSVVYEMQGDGGTSLGFMAAMEGKGAAGARLAPFEKWFRTGNKRAEKSPRFASYWRKGDAWRQIEDDWLDSAGQLALNLDSDTNNTSLVLAFELKASGRILLFPGDAQIGNWLSWAKLSWRVGDGVDRRTVKAEHLLARTVFYKVAHHGSHNATLRQQGLELMTHDELVAMLPVSREMAKKRNWKMPFDSLFRRLEEGTKGRILDRDTFLPKKNPGPLTAEQWRRFVERTREQKDWIDYFVEL